jgi:hypothetical protein
MKFRMFPTPKYLRIRNSPSPADATIPLLEFPRIMEKRKRKLEKRRTKNKGTAKVVPGSMKYTKQIDIKRRMIVIIKVGRKFFRFLTLSSRRALRFFFRSIMVSFYIIPMLK